MGAGVPKLIQQIRPINILGAIPPYVSEEVPAVGDYALNFDGSADHVDYGDLTVLDGMTTITFEGWIYPEVNGSSYFFSKHKSNEWCFNLTLIAGSSYPKLRADFYGNYAATSPRTYHLTDGDAVPLDQWSHIECGIDLASGTGYLFVDGVLQASTKTDSGGGVSAIVNSPSNLLIGGSEDGAALAFEGSVGAMAVWDTVLHTTGFTPPTAYWAGDESGLVFYASINEGALGYTDDLVNDHVGTIASFEEAMWITGPGLDPAGTEPTTMYALDLDPRFEQHALAGHPAAFNGLGSEITCQARVLFHALPGTDEKFCWVIKSDEDNALRAWQFGLRDVSGTLRLWAWMTRATSAGGADNGVLDFRYTWTPTLETWYTVRISVDLAGETAYAIIDGTPNAMTKAENGSGGYLANVDCPVWLGYHDGIYANMAVSHLMLAEDYTATQDTATYPLDEEPDHTDYDLTGIFAYWKCQAIVDGALVDEVNGNNAILLPFDGADFEKGDTEVVVVPDAAALDVTGDLAISCWFKMESLPINTFPYMPLGKWVSGSTSYYLLAYYHGPSDYRFKILADSGTGNGVNLIGSTSVFNVALVGQWHHILGTIDVSARTSKLFLDGVELTRVTANAGSGTAIHAGTADVGIGAQANGANYCDGLLAKVRLFNYYFDTEAKVAAELATALSEHANLVEEWRMDDGAAGTFLGENGEDGEATSGIIPVVGGNARWPENTGYADFELGDTEYVSVGDVADVRLTGDISIGCWFAEETSPTVAALLGKWDTGASKRSYIMYLYAAKIYFEIDTGTGDGANLMQFHAPFNPVSGAWHHIFVTADLSARTAKIFVDGVELTATNDSVGSGTTINNEDAPLMLGAYMSSGAPTGYCDGLMAHVRLYDAYIIDTDVIRAERRTDRSTHADLVEEWPLDETAQFAATQNSPTNDGTETSGTIPISRSNNTPHPANYGAADFEAGDTEYVDCGNDASLQQVGDITLSAWVKIEALTGSNQSIISKYDTGAGKRCYQLIIAAAGTPYILVETGTGSGANYIKIQMTTAYFASHLGEWVHLHGTVDVSARTGKIFIDGVEQTVSDLSIGSGTAINNEDAPVTLGAYLNSGSPTIHLDGLMAHVRLYDGYITVAADVVTEMEAGRSEHADLVEEWPLEADFLATQNSDNDGTETSGTIPFTTPIFPNTPALIEQVT